MGFIGQYLLTIGSYRFPTLQALYHRNLSFLRILSINISDSKRKLSNSKKRKNLLEKKRVYIRRYKLYTVCSGCWKIHVVYARPGLLEIWNIGILVPDYSVNTTFRNRNL